MAIDTGRVKELFQAAIELANPAERRAFLDREAAGPSELRDRVDALLAVFDAMPALVDANSGATVDVADDVSRPAVDATVAEATAAYVRKAGSLGLEPLIAGRYKIRQEIGEGGMGSVYLAEQTQPVKRQVALKLIKAGMDSRNVLARFESERQALALMDHPNIAKVLDAGADADGRPFFVMELVKGVPLTEYCDAHRLDLPARLALFRQICSAVQHAHQKGIIHRDLKPGNILVESHDGVPVPKVIDFGLAKATSGMQLSEHSLYTAFGIVVGTPLYMAPEQAAFNALDVDTRADVYALGVILYELLAGSTPILRETIKAAALDEMMRIIREVEPPTPSSRLSSSETLPSIAATRRIEPSRLSRFVRGDLDWIVMKALAKERSRRYESASALAQDLDRFVAHEPVSAGPPTAGYRLRKFIRRNRGRVVAGTLLLAALVAGVVGTSLGLVEARRQRRAAETRLAQKDRANAILLRIFNDLHPDTRAATSRSLSERLGHQLEHAADELDGEATDDPLGVARMQMTLGQSLTGLGYPRKAIEVASKALAVLEARLGPDDSDVIRCMIVLATAYRKDGDTGRALPLLMTSLERSRRAFGPDHDLAGFAASHLAEALSSAGRLAEALPLKELVYEQARRRSGPAAHETLLAMNNLGDAYRDAGQLEKSIELLERVVLARKIDPAPTSNFLIAAMNNLALAYRFSGRYDKAIPIHEEVLEKSRATIGRDHPDTLANAGNLAEAYRQAGRVAESVPLFEEAHSRLVVRLGPDHPYSLISGGDLANVYRDIGKGEQAMAKFEDVYVRSKAKLGPGHPSTLIAQGDLCESYIRQGLPEKAMPLALDLIERRTIEGNPPTKELGYALMLAGRSSLDRRLWTQAEPYLRESLAIREATLPGDWRTFSGRSLLGSALLGRKDYVAAAPLLKSGYEGMKRDLGKIPPYGRVRIAETLDRLIELAEATGEPDEGNRWREEKARVEARLKPTVPVGTTPKKAEDAQPSPDDARPAVPTGPKPAATPPTAGGRP